MSEPVIEQTPRIYRWTVTFISLLIAIAILNMETPEGLTIAGQRLAAVLTLMAILWCTQALPLAVTSLIPLFAFPFLQIQSAGEVSKSYMNATILLYFSGFAIAIGVEKWGLHRRLALFCLSVLGSGPKRIVLGFMLGTGLLSMWISNTASTLLMLPIAIAVLGTLSMPNLSEQRRKKLEKRFAVALLLGIAYAASIGGMCTIIGTPTNGVYVGYWGNLDLPAQELQKFDVSLGKWFFMFFPMTVALFVTVWLVICVPIWRGVSFGENAGEQIREQYRSLGSMSSGEFKMLIIFATTALLWMTRSSIELGSFTLTGWEEGLSAWLENVNQGVSYRGLLHDSTAGLLMMTIMFLIPVRTDDKSKTDYLIDWPSIERKTPWGILLLFGGGFAIASGCSTTGLSNWLGEQLASRLEALSETGQVMSVATLVIFLTEFTSNTATLSALLPILEKTARSLSLDPRLLMLPATIAASAAFMLPIATPPNAIVFSSNRISVGDMMKVGFVLNLLGIAIITAISTLWVLRIS